MRILLFTLFLVSGPGALSNSSPNQVDIREEIFQQIIRNKPDIHIQKALLLSSLIVKESNKVDINPKLFTAILMQESGYRLNAKNCKDTNEGYEICLDFGVSQINYKTILLYKFDKKRLMTDIEYSIEAGLQVLSDFKKRYGHKEINYWSRYNTSNPKARKKYQKQVERWL